MTPEEQRYKELNDLLQAEWEIPKDIREARNRAVYQSMCDEAINKRKKKG